MVALYFVSGAASVGALVIGLFSSWCVIQKAIDEQDDEAYKIGFFWGGLILLTVIFFGMNVWHWYGWNLPVISAP